MAKATEGLAEGCSTEDGLCRIAGDGSSESRPQQSSTDPEVVYFGDPMCSWCWGISSQLRRLHDWCLAEAIPFRLVMGGLRAGGGDAWDDRFRNFLRHHWEDVARSTGATFNTGLLDLDFFEYDTEPACRAVVAARMLGVVDELAFFSAVQRGFYVDNEDPKRPAFYAARCSAFGIAPGAFLEQFESDAAKSATRSDFASSRAARVTGFPTIALRTEGTLAVVATGYATFDDMRRTLGRLATAAG
jgi:putative protein-disulfide isomerase